MVDYLFYFFAAVTIIASLSVVISRDVIGSAISMIVALLATACLFVLLEAYFLAVIEVLVYAGAVMVLFLFIIMLLDVDREAKTIPKWGVILASIVGGALLVAGACYLFLPENPWKSFSIAETPVTALPLAEATGSFATSVKAFGLNLFTRYLLPFEVAGFMLFIAMIGVVVISKKQSPPVIEEDVSEP